MFLDDLIANIAANIVTAALIGLSVYVALYVHMSGIAHAFRRFVPPGKRVFALHNIKVSGIVRLPKSDFVSPLPEHERDIIVRFHASRNNSTPFNGDAVRLDRIAPDPDNKGCIIASVSTAGFFDFIATNLVAYPANAPITSFRRQIATALQAVRIMGSIQQVAIAVEKYGRPTTVEDVLQNRSLANIVAVSVLLVDSTGRAGIVKRAPMAAVSSGNYGATCTGTVNGADLNALDPFLACAVRETKEETGIEIAAENLCFDGMLVPKQKMQPIFLYYGILPVPWEGLLPQIETGKDMLSENTAFYAVPEKDLAGVAARLRTTDTAAYQIWRYVTQNRPAKDWRRAILQRAFPLNMGKYLLWENKGGRPKKAGPAAE
jgi:8-oxo-dGTP pyrophosphatase MutT (NUDIX family)